MKIVLTNDFHNSKVTLIASNEVDGRLLLSAGQVRRAKETLCGHPECNCSGDLGERPIKSGLYAVYDSSRGVLQGATKDWLTKEKI